MNHKEEFSEQEINDFFNKVEIPLGKDKDLIWVEKFESLVNTDQPISSKGPSVFRLYWRYGMVASFALLMAAGFYLGSQNPVQKEANVLKVLDSSEHDLLADQTMIESLFVEDNDFDEWFEEQYVLSSVN